MSIRIASINVNGLRQGKKRNCVFHWLKSKDYDVVCLQETHCSAETLNQWGKEWKDISGGTSIWNNGSSESRGVAILLSSKLNLPITEMYRDNVGRLLKVKISSGDFKIILQNIYAPNDGVDRKLYFDSLRIRNERDDEYCCILGDFNCTLDKNMDRNPTPQRNDIGTDQVKNIISSNNLCDIWRVLNPSTIRYTFKRNNSKSRIDYILISNDLSSLSSNVKIIHFPFSDHDLITSKFKMNDIERGPGVWVMNENTITSPELKSAFDILWENRILKINNYPNLKEWWDITKLN